MNAKANLAFAAALVALVAGGCSGGSSNDAAESGPSLHQQFQQAMADNNPPTRAEALTRVGYQQHRTGNTSGSAEAFREAAKAAAAIEDPFRRANAECLLASAYARTGNKSDASKTLKSATEALGKIQSPEDLVELRSRIATIYAADLQSPGNAATMLQAAETTAETIPNPIDRLNATLAIIRAHHKANSTEDGDRLHAVVSELLVEVTDPRDRADALVGIGRTLIAADQKDEGVQKLDAALESVEQIDDGYKKVFVLTAAADEYARAGQADKARDVLGQADTLAKGITEVDLRKQAEEKVRQHRANLPAG